MFRIVLHAPAWSAARLAEALRETGRAAVVPPEEDGMHVVVAASFAEDDLSAAADLRAPEKTALIAAEIPSRCFFAELLLARARRRWRHAAALPPLREAESFAEAAKKITDALRQISAPDIAPKNTTTAEIATTAENNRKPENGGAKDEIAPRDNIVAASAAVRAGDFPRARQLLAGADGAAVRALSLLMAAKDSADPAGRQRAMARLRREIANLSESEKAITGAPAFLAAAEARRVLEDIL